MKIRLLDFYPAGATDMFSPARFSRSTGSAIFRSLLAFCALSLTADAGGTEETKMAVESEEMIVVLGASYAKDWSFDSINGTSIVNKGIGGNQSFEMLSRFEEDVVALGPDTVIIWGFINDIFRSENGELEDAKIRIKRSYEDMLAIATNNDIEVVLATELSLREPQGALNWLASVLGRIMGKTSYQDMINQHVFEVNNWLKSYADSRQLLLLDFQNALADSDGRRRAEFATADGSHVTPEAYDVLSHVATEALNSDHSMTNQTSPPLCAFGG
jgi:lysophospholipase L1-like esterase